jgi:predicted alpha/beta hydrolase family esterase
MDKPQIIYVHGGDAFENKEDLYALLRSRSFNPYAEPYAKWRDYIKAELVDSYDSIFMQMPNSLWADYEAWKIWFDKVIPYLHEDVVLIGHSLGGGFYLRYLTENTLPVRVRQLHLVAGVVDGKDCGGVGGFMIGVENWPGFASAISEVHLWHSEDDTSVPIHHS